MNYENKKKTLLQSILKLRSSLKCSDSKYCNI